MDIFTVFHKRRLRKAYLASRGLFLHLISRIFRTRKHLDFRDRLETILIVAPPRIGDAALALPVFHALRQAYPSAEIHALASTYVADILCLTEKVDRVLPTKGTASEKSRFLCRFRKSSYDLAIDLNFDYHLWPALVAGLAGAFSIGYDYAGRGVLFSLKLPKPDSDRHVVDIFLEPVRRLEPKIRGIAPRIDVTDELVSETHNFLSEIGISTKDKMILIHPGAHHPTQRWLPEYFAQTADKIIEDRWARLIFIGGPDEKELMTTIQQLMTNAPDGSFLGLGIKDLIGLINRADLMICNNSGPLHIAVATNTQTISTMGPTIKKRWMPIGDIHKVLRMDDLPCIGCNLGYCKIETHDCMRLITPSIALEAAKDFIRT